MRFRTFVLAALVGMSVLFATSGQANACFFRRKCRTNTCQTYSYTPCYYYTPTYTYYYVYVNHNDGPPTFGAAFVDPAQAKTYLDGLKSPGGYVVPPLPKSPK